MTRNTIDTTELAKPEGPWLGLSGRLTQIVHMLSKRDDLIVNIAPGAAYDAPAAMLPTVANIEIDSDFWPKDVNPDQAYPADKRDWENYPGVMGLLAHEASHADHSQWSFEIKKAHNEKTHELSDQEMKAFGAAELLEESRIEAAHLDERPQDMPWMQASATTIALGEILKKGIQPFKAAATRAAALILARETAGSLSDSPDLDTVREAIEFILGFDPGKPDESTTTIKRRGERTVNKMEDIWTEFQNLPDNAPAKDFLRLGQAWYDIAKDDGGDGDDDQETQSGGTGGTQSDKRAQQASQQLADALENIARDADGTATGNEARARLQKKLAEAAANRKAEAAKQQEAKDTAQDVWHGQQASRGMGYFDVLQGYRKPSTAEIQRASKTARDILKAYYRAKAVTMVKSVVPPGRLDTRAAMASHALRSMGLSTAEVEPFIRKDRRKTPNPPLRVGIIQDASGSQDSPAAAAASGAWSLATAVRAIPDGMVAMLTFGDRVQPIIHPMKKPEGVPEIHARGGTSYLSDAMRAMEGELQLMRQGAARLLVIITDGFLYDDEMYIRDANLIRLLNAGVKVLWVVTGHQYSYKMGGFQHMDQSSHVLVVPDIKHRNLRVVFPFTGSDRIPDMITSEAVNTLRETNV